MDEKLREKIEVTVPLTPDLKGVANKINPPETSKLFPVFKRVDKPVLELTRAIEQSALEHQKKVYEQALKEGKIKKPNF